MNVRIIYCGAWGYERQAVSLAAKIKRVKGVDAIIEKSSGGVFEIIRDGELVFSKKALGRFPHSDEEVLAKL